MTSAPADPAASHDDVLAAYRSFWDTYLRAADPMNPAHPDLDRVATGDELDQVRTAFAGHFGRAEAIRGSADLAPVVESFDADVATVRDCYLDRTDVVDAATGAAKDDSPEQSFEVVATLRYVSGTWKVSSLRKESVGCR